MATSLTTNIGHGSTPYYTAVIKTFLEGVNSVTGFKQDATQKSVPLGSGTRAQFTQMVNLAKVTAKLTDEVTNPTAKAAKLRFLYATPDLWGDTVEVSQLTQDTTPDDFEAEVVRRLGEQAGRSIHTQLGTVLSGISTTDDVAGAVYLLGNGGISGKTTIADGVAASSSTNSTTAFVYDNTNSPSGTLAAAVADWCKGGYIVFYDPTSQNRGLARKILAYDATSDIVHWTTAINVAVATSEKAYICGGEATDGTQMTEGTNVLGAVDFRRAVRVLRRGKARRFGDGYFHGGIDPDDSFGLENATGAGSFQDIHKYTTAAPMLRINDEIILHGIKMKYMSEPHTIDKTTKTYTVQLDDDGAYHTSYVVGQGAFGYAGFANKLDTAIKITRPGSQTTNDPLGLKDVLGWITSYADLPIDAAQAVLIATFPKAIE